MMKPLPNRDQIALKICALSSGELSRDDVSAWAMEIVLDDEYTLSDETAWQVINALGGVDTPSTDRPYLYGHSDFEEWLKMLG
jgi:hypothetical protein